MNRRGQTAAAFVALAFAWLFRVSFRSNVDGSAIDFYGAALPTVVSVAVGVGFRAALPKAAASNRSSAVLLSAIVFLMVSLALMMAPSLQFMWLDRSTLATTGERAFLAGAMICFYAGDRYLLGICGVSPCAIASAMALANRMANELPMRLYLPPLAAFLGMCLLAIAATIRRRTLDIALVPVAPLILFNLAYPFDPLTQQLSVWDHDLSGAILAAFSLIATAAMAWRIDSNSLSYGTIP